MAAGEEHRGVTSGGVDRSYIRHVPPAHDGTTPLPLVVDVHGYSEGADIHVLTTQLGAFGDEHDFVTITPQGLGVVARWDPALESADVAFVGDLLDDVEGTLCIDLDRIHVAGFSNGAFLTSAVACAYADRVASVAPVAGIQDPDGCEPDRPVPIVAFHGTADGFVSYDGGLGEAAARLPAPDGSDRTLGDVGVTASGGPSVPEVAATWAERNGCETTPDVEEVADDVTLISYPCPTGADVELYRITDGGHAWPGSAFSASIERIVGRTTMSISANEVLWRFFEEHPLR